mgnify:FL=1
MKRILSLFGILLVLSVPLFAKQETEAPESAPNEQTEQNDGQSEENIKTDEDDDVENIVRKDDYSRNGKGDQFLKIGIMGNFPLNFGDQLTVGGSAQLGYYRFMNSWLALGGELMAGYNPTIGSNVFTFVPITFGVMFQPSAGRFEFPHTLSVGFAFETCANKKYFPGFSAKAETGAFFRITEGWSVGLNAEFLYLPEWYTTTKNADSDYGIFMEAGISARYHF